MIRKENSPYVSIQDYIPLPSGEFQYSRYFMETRLAVVLEHAENHIISGICDTEDTELMETLRHYHGVEISFKKILREDLFEYLGKLHSSRLTDGIPDKRTDEGKLLLDEITDNAPVINLVNSIIMEAIRKNASDIHIEAFEKAVNVRYRIDGVLDIHNRLNPSLFPPISSRIKIMAGLNIMEKRMPQDGRISVSLGSRIRDIRVSVVPTAYGESVVLRLLDRESNSIDLESLGLNPKALEDLKRIPFSASGLVLVTGPTGSGKTTTLNSLLRKMDTKEKKIVTVEDPVEYLIEGINQIQTRNSIGLTFDSLLRRILRQDPDIIMIGEIRDTETAKLAVRSALTGHLVLSTLHTENSTAVIDRLTDMGIQPFMIAAVLKVSMAQRLVRKLCMNCRKKRKIRKTELRFFKNRGRAPSHLFEPAGCDKCSGKGYTGRILIHEYFFTDGIIKRMISSGSKHSGIRNYLAEKGTVFLADDALGKVERGLTSLEEIERAAVIR